MKYRKIAAALMAAVISAGSLAVPGVGSVQVLAADNIITNGTFDKNTRDWGFWQDSDASADISCVNQKLQLRVDKTGGENWSVQLYFDGVPMYKNGVYHVSFEIASDVNRSADFCIQENGGTYQAYTYKSLKLTNQPQKVDYNFTMTADTDTAARFQFNLGKCSENPGVHNVTLDNVKLELIDSSRVNPSEIIHNQDEDKPQGCDNILVNQIGYRPDADKVAVFRNVSGQSEFKVVNAETNQTVYEGTLKDRRQNSDADETDWYGDFSKVTKAGKYYITCDSLGTSYTFTIGNDVYSDVNKDLVRMMYLQRCGTDIKAGDSFNHSACHTGRAQLYHTSETIDVSGGWHDAGDYGRYVVPVCKTIADLLTAYDNSPESFGDDSNIPESGNGVPDILDEVKWGMTWMQKMQDKNSGGVHHKVSCKDFPGYVMPTEENGQLIVTPISTTATADFAGAMAMGYEYLKSDYPAFAKECLASAEKAWSYLESNPSFIFSNPSDISTGDYGDKSDEEERYWAAAQLYRETGKDTYKNYLESHRSAGGMDWRQCGTYGQLAILTDSRIDKSSSIYKKAYNAFISDADEALGNSQMHGYGEALSTYEWGSNMTCANNAAVMGMAYKLTGDEDYYLAAEKNVDYLFGRNANNVCFVTGYGSASPQHPHHRPSMCQKQAMKGMLVGGPDFRLEDGTAKTNLVGEPAAKCWIDNSESYSTNEVTTYWNSPMVFLLSTLSKTTAQPTATPKPTATPVPTATSTPKPTATTTTKPTSTPKPTDTPVNHRRIRYSQLNLDGEATLFGVVNR